MGGALGFLLVFGFPHLITFFCRTLKCQKPGIMVYATMSLVLFPFGFLALGAEVFDFGQAMLIGFLVSLSTWRYSKIASSDQ